MTSWQAWEIYEIQLVLISLKDPTYDIRQGLTSSLFCLLSSVFCLLSSLSLPFSIQYLEGMLCVCMWVKNISGCILKHVDGCLEILVMLFRRNRFLLSVITSDILVFGSSIWKTEKRPVVFRGWVLSSSWKLLPCKLSPIVLKNYFGKL